MLIAAAATAFWIGGLVRLRGALSQPAKRPLCLALLTLGSGALFDVDPLYARFDQAVGVANLSDFMAHGLGLVGVYFLLRTFDGLAATTGSRRGSSRWLLPVLIVVLASSAALFAATPMPTETSAFTATYGTQPTIAGYWALSIAFPTLCLVQLMRASIAHWNAQRPEHRIGLRLVAAGSAVGFFYAALKLSEIATAIAADYDLARHVRAVDLAALGSGLLTIGVGLAVMSTGIGRRLAVTVADLYVHFLIDRLEWLWRTVCLEARAADVLDDGHSPSDSEFVLSRRVIEIRDGEAELWSLLTIDDADELEKRAGLSSRPGPLQLEAAGLALALTRRLYGVDTGHEPTLVPMSSVSMGLQTLPLDVKRDARELISLSRLVKRAIRHGH